VHDDVSTLIEWGVVSRALGDDHGGVESGDLHVVAPFAEGVLVAVIDGLGHGEEAAAAAKAAAQVLESDAAASLISLIERCHERLRRTRGAVMSLASFNRLDSSITWTGVGNVTGLLVRADAAARGKREAIATRGGVIGYQLPPLRPVTCRVSTGDTLVLVTDGIRSDFASSISLVTSPQALADSIMKGHRRHADDALVLVARYLGYMS
jgi:serine phosphatase RsbU (regulator of sigma subunit)